MLIPERQSRLKELVRDRGVADLESLSAELHVSGSTIRRDLELLEAEGLVKRTYGGAIWIGEQKPSPRGDAFDHRINFQRSAKQAIARTAASLIEPAETILIDGGTTTYHLARILRGRAMQVVTNSLPIADVFQDDENVELIVAGGLVYPRYGVMLGPTVESMLATIHARTMLFSVAGIHDGMLYNQNLLLVSAERKMMQCAQRVILLCDSSKFGQQALAQLCPLSEIDIVVTDPALGPDHREAIRSAGCELIIAEP